MQMLFMAYIKDTINAVDFYCKAFNTTSKKCFKASDEDDFYGHAEIEINDKIILGLSDTTYYNKEFPKGNNMEFWLIFDDEQSLQRTYEALKEEAEIHYPLSPCEWSKAMASLTDKYGINWLLNI